MVMLSTEQSGRGSFFALFAPGSDFLPAVDQHGLAEIHSQDVEAGVMAPESEADVQRARGEVEEAVRRSFPYGQREFTAPVAVYAQGKNVIQEIVGMRDAPEHI